VGDYEVVKKNDSPVETGFPNQLGSVRYSVSTEQIQENASGYWLGENQERLSHEE
jgi:hypothetical protein